MKWIIAAPGPRSMMVGLKPDATMVVRLNRDAAMQPAPYNPRRVMFKVSFDSMQWQAGRPGVRYKLYREGSQQLRLVEFETSDGFGEWCHDGHIGYVLAGGLEIDVNGRVLSFAAGDGLFIPAGEGSRHRAISITPGTRLVMVEDAVEED